MGKLHTFTGLFTQWLWRRDTRDEAKPAKILRHFAQVITAIIADLKEGQLSLRAMSLVYTTIISLVPLFAISFSVLKGLGAHNQIKPFLLNAFEPLGDKRIEITDKIIGFVDNIQVGVLGALGIILLVYTVIGMMQKIEHAFNYVWHVTRLRSFSERFSDYLSVLLVGPLLIFLSSGMTATVRNNEALHVLDSLPFIEHFHALIGVVIPYLILSAAFTFLYSFVPNTKVNLKAAFLGGLVTALVWKLMGWGFSTFVANSANHTAIYSAFATIIVFMVWVYLVWLVLLIGSSFSFYWQHPEYRKLRHNQTNASPKLKEAIALQLMEEVGRRFHLHKKPIHLDELSEHINQPQKVVQEIAEYLESAKLLITGEKDGSFLVARPLEHISVYDILNAVRTHHGNTQLQLHSVIVSKLMNKSDALQNKAFKDTSLHTLVKS